MAGTELGLGLGGSGVSHTGDILAELLELKWAVDLGGSRVLHT